MKKAVKSAHMNGDANPLRGSVAKYNRTLLEYYTNYIVTKPPDFDEHEWVEIDELTVDDVSDWH